MTVRAVEKDVPKVVVDEEVDSAWAMSVHHMKTYRVKRKIVVYVEYCNYKGAKALENKQSSHKLYVSADLGSPKRRYSCRCC